MPHTAARPRRVLVLTFFCALLPALIACHSKSAPTPENFITGLNAHFMDHPDCLLNPAPHFPYETSDKAETARLNALVADKLLDVSVEPAIHVSRYTVTDAGARYAPRFCYGHRVVTAIDHFSPPAPANGFTETTVTYRYTMTEVPVWAKSAKTQEAFPVLSKALNGESTGTATLAETPVGWQVPD
jgi:hypothetical protein